MTSSSDKPRESKIPVFNSVEEEAEFWDTHDSTEFADEFEDVDDIEFVGVISRGYISMRMDDHTLDELQKCAEAKDVALADLLYTWIEERLDAERKSA
jgi:hypothetical protein